jgi:ankyrin repeat protein
MVFGVAELGVTLGMAPHAIGIGVTLIVLGIVKLWRSYTSDLDGAARSDESPRPLPSFSVMAQKEFERSPPPLAEALESAADCGNTELVRDLLNAGANPQRPGRRGEIPLTKAIRGCHFETAQVLLSAVPEAEHRSQLKAALRSSVYAQNLLAVRYILKHSPDIYDEADDSSGESPLEGAAARGDPDLLRLLLACGPCQVEGATSTHEHSFNAGHTTLMSSVLSGSLDAVRVLVNAGANVRAREQRLGYTPLVFACYTDKRRESAQVAGFLLERGAELDVRAHDGSTPLMVAVAAGQYEVILTLLRFGPQLKVRDKNGRDVFDLAQLRENRRVDELLATYCSASNRKRDHVCR